METQTGGFKPSFHVSTCDKCEQTIKLYKKTIHADLARGLIMLSKLKNEKNDFIHLPTICVQKKINYQNMSIALAAYWGLVESMENDNPLKKCSGKWRITQAGLDFINGGQIEKYKYIYNKKMYKIHGEKIQHVTIKDCLKKKFNFQDLMSDSYWN